MLDRLLYVDGMEGAEGSLREWPDNANPDAWYFLYIQEATRTTIYERTASDVYKVWLQILTHIDWSILERPNSRPTDMSLMLAFWKVLVQELAL